MRRPLIAACVVTATLGLAPIYAAMVLIVVATAISATNALIVGIEAVALVGFVVAAVQLAVLYRRAGRFIAKYSAEGDA